MKKKAVSGGRRAYILTMRILMGAAAIITAALVLFLIAYVLIKGLPNVSWTLLSTAPSYLSDRIGILPDILNTLYIVIATLLIVLPLGVGAAIYLLAYPVLTCILSRKLFYFGYKSGLEGMSGFMATGKMDILTNSMNFMGLLVVGALTASFVSCSIPFQIVKDVFDAATGEVLAGQVIFNADATINNIFPRLVPLGLTLGVYWLYAKKKWSPLKLMGLILFLAAILTGIGYMSGFYA